MRPLLFTTVVGSLALLTPASAEWPHDAFSCSSYRADLVWHNWAREHCRSYEWRWRHYRPRPIPDADLMRSQLRLQQLGYRLEADGLNGSETRDAVYRFQRDRHLEATGELDRRTKTELHEESEERESDKPEWFKGPPKICPERRDGETRHCACESIQVTTGEHIWKDGKAESMKRWKGAVRSSFGELFMGWKHAADRVDVCWHSGTGERTVDRHVRCLRQARPCWGILQGNEMDELELDVSSTQGGKD